MKGWKVAQGIRAVSVKTKKPEFKLTSYMHA